MKKLFTILAAFLFSTCIHAQSWNISKDMFYRPSINNSGALVVLFEEDGFDAAGLTLDYTLTGRVDVNYGCFDGGRIVDFQTITQSIAAAATFNTNGNLSAKGSFTVPPPGPTLSCAASQKLAMISVTYSWVTIHDITDAHSLTFVEAVFFCADCKGKR